MAKQPNNGRSKVERYARYREWQLPVVGHFEPQLWKYSSHCWLVHRGEKAESRQALASAVRYVYLGFCQIRQSCPKIKRPNVYKPSSPIIFHSELSSVGTIGLRYFCRAVYCATKSEATLILLIP